MPEVVLEHPEVVRQLHRDFVHAGSDVVEALTYYAHREKLRVIGREQDLEPINRRALEIAKSVATETGALFAGDICNTNVYDPADPASHKAVRAMFEEQVGWAVDAGVDFIIGETFSYAQEALIALDVIKRAGKTAVITLAMHQADVTREDWSGGRSLQAAGRCRRRRGRPELHSRPGDDDAAAARDSRARSRCRWPRCRCLIAPASASLRSSRCAMRTGTTTGQPAVSRSRSIRSPAIASRSPSSAREALALDIRYLGVCCGAGPHHIRALAEAVGKHPPASKYSADMSKHAFLGSHERIKKVQKDYANKL